MKLLISAALAGLIALPAFAADAITVTDAYIRALGGGTTTGAAFMKIENHTDRPDRLIGAHTDVAAKAELHTHSKDAHGMMTMVPVPDGFEIPAHGEHALARGHDHVMLMGLKRDLAEGEIVSLTLTFEHAGDVIVEAPVDNQRKP